MSSLLKTKDGFSAFYVSEHMFDRKKPEVKEEEKHAKKSKEIDDENAYLSPEDIIEPSKPASEEKKQAAHAMTSGTTSAARLCIFYWSIIHNNSLAT